MDPNQTINIRMTIEEKIFAREQSKKYPGCPRPNEGSVAHYVKYIIREHAKKLNYKMDGSEITKKENTSEGGDLGSGQAADIPAENQKKDI